MGIRAANLEVGPGKTYTQIQAAIDAASAGDTVSVYKGTYRENLRVNVENLLLRSVVLHGAVLRGYMRLDRNGVSVTGFEITNWTNTAYAGINCQGKSNISISKNHIHHPAGKALSGINLRNSTNVSVDSNTIHHSIKGIRVHSSHSPDNSYQTGTRITRNTIHDNFVDGIDIHGQYILIEENRIYNNINEEWVNNHPDGIQIISSQNIDGYDAAQHVIIARNLIRNHNQNIFVEGFSTSDMDAEDIHIFGNVIYNESGTVNGAFMDDAGSWGANIRNANNVHIYNNTFGPASNSSLGIRPCVANSVFIYNNIFANNRGGPSNGLYVEDEAAIGDSGVDYNLYFSTGNNINIGGNTFNLPLDFNRQYPSYAVHGKHGNPLLQNWETGALGDGSPAIDAGRPLPDTYRMDFTGTERPLGKGWDMGAVETQGIPNSSPSKPGLISPPDKSENVPSPVEFN